MGEYSEEENEIDIESDDIDDRLSSGGYTFATETEKKTHHNALERKRRDQIKDSFNRLRNVIPQGRDEKISRAQILQRATKHIHYMSNKNHSGQKEIDILRRKIRVLRQQEKHCILSTVDPGEQREPSEHSDTSEDNLDSFYYNNKNNNNLSNNRNKKNNNRNDNINDNDSKSINGLSYSTNTNHFKLNSNLDDVEDFSDLSDNRGKGKTKRAKMRDIVQ